MTGPVAYNNYTALVEIGGIILFILAPSSMNPNLAKLNKTPLSCFYFVQFFSLICQSVKN